MAESWERKLGTWQSAGLIDQDTAGRIRAFENAQGSTATRWAVWVAVSLGVIALGAGVLLFVASHWDELSPASRFTLVTATLAGFHLAGLWTRDTPVVSMGLHALGTVALGAAIALTGQVFHMEEHWAGGVLLWMLGALAGWLLLRDWLQLTLLALLAPAWVIAEWLRWNSNSGSSYLTLFLLILAVGYLVSEIPPLRWIGGIALIPTYFIIAFDARRSVGHNFWGYVLVALAAVIAMALARFQWKGVLVTLAWGLLFRQVSAMEWKIAWHAWGAIGWIGLVGWGVYRAQAERINIGIIGFAATVLSFYFANVMDKLGRSLSLIVMGALFLGGGWLLERLRRHLIAEIRS